MIAILEFYTQKKRCVWGTMQSNTVRAKSLQAVVFPVQLPGLLFWKQYWDFPSRPAGQVGLPSPSCKGPRTQAH